METSTMPSLGKQPSSKSPPDSGTMMWKFPGTNESNQNPTENTKDSKIYGERTQGQRTGLRHVFQ